MFVGGQFLLKVFLQKTFCQLMTLFVLILYYYINVVLQQRLTVIWCGLGLLGIVLL